MPLVGHTGRAVRRAVADVTIFQSDRCVLIGAENCSRADAPYVRPEARQKMVKHVLESSHRGLSGTVMVCGSRIKWWAMSGVCYKTFKVT